MTQQLFRQPQAESWLLLTHPQEASSLKAAFQRWKPAAQLSCWMSPSGLAPEAASASASESVPESASEFSGAPSRLPPETTPFASWLRRPCKGVLVSPTVELSPEQQRSLMQERLQKGRSVYQLIDFCERFWKKLPPDLLATDWFVFKHGFRLQHSARASWTKRGFDLIAVLLLLVMTLPIMVVAAIAIKLTDPGPILYSQLRNGKDGVPFRVYKFRSMYQDAEARGAQWASERDPRITPVGHWLRILRIDELPQIWNVLKGEMSLIGPRPERPEFDVNLEKKISHYGVRYSVKPGITGWAQVMYPYGASVEDAYEKLSYDLYYIKNYSLWLDLVIVLKTVRVVLFGKGR